MEPSTISLDQTRRLSVDNDPGKSFEKEEFSNESNGVSEKSLTEESEPQEEWIEGIKLVILVTGITLVTFLMLLDTSIVSTAMPRITTQFHSLDDVGWYGASYQLASAALQPLTGKFYTFFGGKWTFLTFFAVFELGSLLCGVATSSIMLVVGRAVAGMGASGIQNGAFTIIAQSVPMGKRPFLMGIVLGISQLGAVFGPLIGGVLTQYTTWRWCFYINLPIGGVVALLMLIVKTPGSVKIPSYRTIIHDLDIIGFVLFAPAAIQLLLALEYGGNQHAWDSATIIGLFCGAVGTFAVFLTWEYFKGDDAMIPFSMMRQRVVYSSCIAFGLLLSALYVSLYYIPIFFQAVKNTSPTLSGVYLLPSIMFQLTVAIVAGGLVGKLGYYVPFIICGGVFGTIASYQISQGIPNETVFFCLESGLLSTFDPFISTGKWVGYQILLGTGEGIALQIPVIAVQNCVTPAQIPTAMALVMFSSTLGGALFLSISQTILTNSLRTLIPQYAPAVDPQTVIAAGATGFRLLVSENDLPGVLVAYSKAIDRVFYLCAGAFGGVFLAAWGMGWKDIRTKMPTEVVEV